MQRRHQKVIEEAPVSIAPFELQVQMEQAAVRLAKLVKYGLGLAFLFNFTLPRPSLPPLSFLLFFVVFSTLVYLI